MSLLALFTNLYKNRWLPKVSLCTPSQKRAVLCKGVNTIEDVVLLDVQKEQQPGGHVCPLLTRTVQPTETPRATHQRGSEKETKHLTGHYAASVLWCPKYSKNSDPSCLS